MFVISLTLVSCRIQVFRFRSRRVMPGIMRSILRCATARFSIIALFNAHVSQPYVITGRMYSSCIFLCMFLLPLQPLMMLPTLPKAAQPSAVLFQKLMSGRRSPKSGPSLLYTFSRTSCPSGWLRGVSEVNPSHHS